jgi:hypothetical protein
MQCRFLRPIDPGAILLCQALSHRSGEDLHIGLWRIFMIKLRACGSGKATAARSRNVKASSLGRLTTPKPGNSAHD